MATRPAARTTCMHTTRPACLALYALATGACCCEVTTQTATCELGSRSRGCFGATWGGEGAGGVPSRCWVRCSAGRARSMRLRQCGSTGSRAITERIDKDFMPPGCVYAAFQARLRAGRAGWRAPAGLARPGATASQAERAEHVCSAYNSLAALTGAICRMAAAPRHWARLAGAGGCPHSCSSAPAAGAAAPRRWPQMPRRQRQIA